MFLLDSPKGSARAREASALQMHLSPSPTRPAGSGTIDRCRTPTCQLELAHNVLEVRHAGAFAPNQQDHLEKGGTIAHIYGASGRGPQRVGCSKSCAKSCLKSCATRRTSGAVSSCRHSLFAVYPASTTRPPQGRSVAWRQDDQTLAQDHPDQQETARGPQTGMLDRRSYCVPR